LKIGPRGAVPIPLVAYVVGMTAALLILLNYQFTVAPGPSDHELRANFLVTVRLMATCGALGGCFHSLRGIVRHSSGASFDRRFLLAYYLEPLKGTVAGFLAFFLLTGGAITLNLSGLDGANAQPSQLLENLGWRSFYGRLPYLTISFLAGYASLTLTHKLKHIADTLFSVKDHEPDSTANDEIKALQERLHSLEAQLLSRGK